MLNKQRMSVHQQLLYKIMENEKKDSFNRLSQSRLIKVVDALDILGNCSNRSAYEYTEEEVIEIFKEIEEKVRLTKDKFKFENIGNTTIIPTSVIESIKKIK